MAPSLRWGTHPPECEASGYSEKLPAEIMKFLMKRPLRPRTSMEIIYLIYLSSSRSWQFQISVHHPSYLNHIYHVQAHHPSWLPSTMPPSSRRTNQESRAGHRKLGSMSLSSPLVKPMISFENVTISSGYPLVICYVTMGRSTIFHGKTHYK